MNYEYFMEKALEEAKKSLNAGEFPVGCVIVYDNEVIAYGQRSATEYLVNEIDHAEITALRRFSELKSRYDLNKVTLFSTLEPCLMCYGAIIISGIKKTVYAYEDVMGGGTNCDLSALKILYKESRVSIIPGVLREKSKELFKRFFSDSDNKYLKDTLFAKHALR
ncbi:MAG: nucleoside deaminase [Deltaproteobacteria bacterium]|nr:nucleoside deaminase [Deltaproteobacteria bacterium]